MNYEQDNQSPWTYNPEPQSEPQSEPQVEPQVEIEPEAEPQVEFAPQMEAQPRYQPEYQPEPQPVQQPQAFTGYEVPWQQPQYKAATPKKKNKKKSHTGKVIAIALVCSLVGGVIGSAATLLAGGITTSVGSSSGDHTQVLEGQRPSTVIDITKVDTSKLMTAAEVYATNVNSTVGITTSVTTNFWGYQTTSAASGSGFVLTEDGYILTNHHVIEDSNAITVSFYDGSSKEATLIGYDASNDIAVLKVEAEGLTPVVLGNSDDMNVGDSVVAIGNPLGELTFSLTAGAISALEREVTTSTGITMNLMQTDCAINSGNSGGALFNLSGEVIGITNAKYSGSGSSGEASIDNIGFAIPVNSIKSIVTSLIEKGYITKPYIGVTVTTVSEETQSYGLPKGAAVKSVLEGSPAEAAGLQVNDIITQADETTIDSSNALVAYVGGKNIGDTITLTVYRQGITMTLELTIGEQIQSATEEQTQQSSSQSSQGSQGGQYNPYDPFSGFGNFFGY